MPTQVQGGVKPRFDGEQSYLGISTQVSFSDISTDP